MDSASTLGPKKTEKKCMNYKDLFSPEDYLKEFNEFLGTVEYSDRNPLNTEMFFMWCMIRRFKPLLFIESGTFRGYSTILSARRWCAMIMVQIS